MALIDDAIAVLEAMRRDEGGRSTVIVAWTKNEGAEMRLLVNGPDDLLTLGLANAARWRIEERMSKSPGSEKEGTT